MMAALSEFKRDTDPIGRWLDAHLVEQSGAVVTKGDLFREYSATSKNPATAKAFGQSLKLLRPNLQDAQRQIGNKVEWCWINVKLRPR